MKRAALPTASLLVCGVLVAHAGTATAIARQDAPLSPPSAAATAVCGSLDPASPWWLAFNDSVLNLLQATAGSHRRDHPDSHSTHSANHGCMDTEVAAAYVGLRTLALRHVLSQAVLETTAQQAGLVNGERDDLQAARQTLQQRRDTAQTQMREIESRQLRLISQLSRWTGMTEAQLMGWLAPAMQEHTVPRYRMPTPQRMTSAVQGDGVGDPVNPALTPRSETYDNLRLLSELSSSTALHGQLVATRRVEFESTRQRLQMGQATELELAERYYAMLVDTDRLAALNGELAQAWIRLQGRPGGAQAAPGHGRAQSGSGSR